MKKILYITAFPPNEKTAGQDYSRRLIFDLVKNGYVVDLIYAEYPGHELQIPDTVNVVGCIRSSLLNSFKNISMYPLYTKRYEGKIKKYIINNADKYDVLYFDFSQVHIYAKNVSHPVRILMFHDVICQKFDRDKNPLKKMYLKWIKYTERSLCRYADYCITFSNKDSKILLKEYSVSSIPVNFYLKSPKFNYGRTKVLNGVFGLYGAWNRRENTDALDVFLEKILPYIHNNYEFRIIGGGMDSRYQDKIKKYGNVIYLGFVDNPIEELAKCQALIAPLRKGAGVKVKVVDALTSGTPVLGTDVAFEGIEDNQSFSLLKCLNSAQEYVKCINEWENISCEYKQNAANEFFDRYDTNHFTDYLNDIIKSVKR